MVARINLLPWREERRQERQKRFLITLVAVFASAALLVLFIEFSIGSSIEEQRGRNNYLQTQINQLNKQVKEIKDLEKKRRELLDRMQIIQDLHGDDIIQSSAPKMLNKIGISRKCLRRNNDVLLKNRSG